MAEVQLQGRSQQPGLQRYPAAVLCRWREVEEQGESSEQD